MTTFEHVQRIMGEHRVTTATLADVLDSFGLFGCLSHQLGRICGGRRPFFGQAYTVHWQPVRKGRDILAEQPPTWRQVSDFLVPGLSTGSGRIYLAGCGPLVRDAALAGGMSVTYFSQYLGFEGVVLGGAIRDFDTVSKLDFPVVASNLIPTDTQGSYCVSSVGTSCVIDNVHVRTGDWVFSDVNGTVVVPEGNLHQVLQCAAATEIAEREIQEKMATGIPLYQLIEEVGRI